MKIRYDIEKLQQIIRDFSCITGLSLAVLDTEYHYVVNYSHYPPEFCLSIQQSERGAYNCICCDVELLKKCAESKRFESHVCHAGLVDSAMPIIKNNIIVGYVLFGRIRAGKKIEDILHKIAWLSTDMQELGRQYKKVAFYTPEQIQSIANLSSVILFENAIEIEYNAFIKSVMEYVEHNLSRDLSVGELCERMHVSKNYLYKNCRQDLGCTINEYVTDQRIRAAKQLLHNSKMPIYQIAEEVGLPNYTYFCKLFKQKVGVSPTVFRQRKEHIYA